MYSSCLGFGECIHAGPNGLLEQCRNNWGFLQNHLSVLAQLKVRWMSARICTRFASRSHGTHGKLLNCEISCTKNPQLHWGGGGWLLPQVNYSHQWQIFQTCPVKRPFCFHLVWITDAMVRQETFLMRKNGGCAVLNLGRCLREHVQFLTKVMSPKL